MESNNTELVALKERIDKLEKELHDLGCELWYLKGQMAGRVYIPNKGEK